MRSHLHRLGVPAPDVDDLTQEVFIKVWKNRSLLSGIQTPRAWILKIATNTAFDFGRKRKLNYVEDVETMTDIEHSLPVSTDIMDSQKLADSALKILSWQQRAAIVLYYFEDLKIEEIAEQLELPLGTVKSRLSTAKDKMQDFLVKKGLKSWIA